MGLLVRIEKAFGRICNSGTTSTADGERTGRMKAIRILMLCFAFLAVLLCGTGCFTHATIENLGKTRWSYSWDSTALSPDESEVVIKYRKKTEHDCWPFLTLFDITWDTNSFEEVRTPFEKTDGEDFDPNQYPLYRYKYPLNFLINFAFDISRCCSTSVSTFISHKVDNIVNM